MKAISLVVVNENTLGYLDPLCPMTLFPFRSSLIRGATFRVHEDPQPLFEHDKVRFATVKDFDDYRVSIKGFEQFLKVKEICQ